MLFCVNLFVCVFVFPCAPIPVQSEGWRHPSGVTRRRQLHCCLHRLTAVLRCRLATNCVRRRNDLISQGQSHLQSSSFSLTARGDQSNYFHFVFFILNTCIDVHFDTRLSLLVTVKNWCHKNELEGQDLLSGKL